MFLGLISFALAVLATSNVVVLTPSNFDTIIDGSRPALVEFYAPEIIAANRCGHCKSLAPVYEELADAFAKDKSQLIIAKVDADAHKDLGSKFGVTGFPTLKWFPKGTTKPDDYSEGRDLDSLAKFITEKTGIKSSIKKPVSSVRVLDSEVEFYNVVGKKSNVLVEFYAPWCGHCKSLAPIYEKVAKAYATEPNCIVANVDATVSKDVAEKYEVTGYPTIKFFPAGSTEAVVYEGGRTEADFIEFLNEKCGTDRIVGGGLGPKAGLIDAFEPLIKSYFKTPSAADRKTVLAKVKTLAQQQHALKSAFSSAKYYPKIFEKLHADGIAYVEKEVARLTRILESGNVVAEKRDGFEVRRNILNRILEANAGVDGGDEEVEKDEL